MLRMQCYSKEESGEDFCNTKDKKQSFFCLVVVDVKALMAYPLESSFSIIHIPTSLLPI